MPQASAKSNAVQPDKQGHCYDGLPGLPGVSLEVSPYEVVKKLVRASKFDVAFNHNRVVSLNQRVQKFDY